MIFKRYSSPFLFLEKLIENRKFSSGIDTIYNQKNDERLWEMYLSLIPMMTINGVTKSFVEWKEELTNDNEAINDEVDLEAVREKSKDILKNFKPE